MSPSKVRRTRSLALFSECCCGLKPVKHSYCVAQSLELIANFFVELEAKVVRECLVDAVNSLAKVVRECLVDAVNSLAK